MAYLSVLSPDAMMASDAIAVVSLPLGSLGLICCLNWY